MELDRRHLIKGAALAAAALVAGTTEAQGQTIFHPQIREAIDVFYRNGLYDLLRIDLIPQKIIIQLHRAFLDMYKYPDQVHGQRRWVKQVSEGVFQGLPGGSPDRQIRAILPEGRNPIILTKLGQRYPGTTKIRQEWLFLNVGDNEAIIFENADGSYKITADPGPISLLINNYDNPGGVENPIPHLKLIYPPDGFASDRYLATPNSN